MAKEFKEQIKKNPNNQINKQKIVVEVNQTNIMDSKTNNSVTQSLGLVKNTQQLLELFKVDTFPVLIGSDVVSNNKVSAHRLELYQSQYERTRQLYLATADIRPTYLVQTLKNQFEEYHYFQMSATLDKRAEVAIDDIKQLWGQLHIVDDMIVELVQQMPAHKPVGWQIISQNRNYLQLPTVGRLRYGEPIADQTSLNSYVLGHFGVMSYTYDRAYYIGHILGYLFCCYYFAYLSIGYGVTPLAKSTVTGFQYSGLKTPHLVRLLQTLDGESKKRIYQLAIICAKLSQYTTDKRIEKLLIAEVNDFNKKEQKRDLDKWLANGVMPVIFDIHDEYDD